MSTTACRRLVSLGCGAHADALCGRSDLGGGWGEPKPQAKPARKIVKGKGSGKKLGGKKLGSARQPEPEPADDGFTVPEMSMEAKVKARQDERLHSDRMAAMRQEQKDRERKIVETEVENAVRILCRFLCLRVCVAGSFG